MNRPTAKQSAEGGIEVEAPAWRMTVAADGMSGLLRDAGQGSHPVDLHLPGVLDRTDRTDETLAVDPPVLDTRGELPVITVRRRSSAWTGALTRIECTPEGPQLSFEVTGQGALSQVLPLAVRAALGGRGGGLRPSGHAWQTLFTPNPGPPRRLSRGAGESAVIGVHGDARPGRGHWFFTPAPLCLALTEDPLSDDAAPDEYLAGRPWWTLSVGAPVAELTFTEMAYVPSDGGFHLRFAYEGHTRVDGVHRSPAVLLAPGHRDPYAGLSAHRRWLETRGWASVPRAAGAGQPAWWTEPMFCGWGAQMARARDTGRPAPSLSSRAEYDTHLAHLEAHGLVPGTVVIDDSWQRHYGRWQPDEERWPGLADWIAERHARGQRVLLWWKAWSTDGVPDEFCVRTAEGRPVTIDPGHPGARALLAENIRHMLSSDGLDADGLKIDFTADTPTGEGLRSHGEAWGIALLHQHLGVIHRAAKAAKADALVVTHTPHPAFADVTDMIRLNDMLRLDDPDPYAPVVPQMRLRAAVAAAACPGLPVDTDDWCAPDREQWRAYTAMKDQLGVPALYVATHLDRTGEPLEEFDYASLRRLWSRWRERAGERGGGA
ncbi:hypothetical protein AB0M87_15210 [Streptomyces sp. NPDC051320]|uniref:hypothetical protein n=1 Tax=Streptomyces sp. NPDC051320 TaxID=3154644 RepID=UPI003440E3BF